MGFVSNILLPYRGIVQLFAGFILVFFRTIKGQEGAGELPVARIGLTWLQFI